MTTTRVLLDGNYLLHKNFHTFKNFKVGDTFTGTTYGVLRDVHKYATEHNTKNVVVTWDSRSFRKDLSSDYKSNRSIDTSGFHPYSNVELVREALRGLGVLQYKTEGYESDDLLYTLTRNYEGVHNVVLSSDEDLLGCLNEHTSVQLIKQKVTVNLQNFTGYYGFKYTPENWVTYKSLLGDKSDNVKGVPRIKKVTVQKYLNRENLSSSERSLLSEHSATVESNKKLLALTVVPNVSTLYEKTVYSESDVQSVLTTTKIKSLNAVVRYFAP